MKNYQSLFPARVDIEIVGEDAVDYNLHLLSYFTAEEQEIIGRYEWSVFFEVKFTEYGN